MDWHTEAPLTEGGARTALAFLSGGGEAGALLRAQDWGVSALGPPEGWPQALRTVVAILLGSNQPMFVAWGEGRTLLYNDRYAEVLAAKHPAAMGRDFLAVWHEIRDDLAPIVEQAYRGEPVQMDDIPLVMERRGFREQTHFSFFYSPVRDEAGAVAGFLCACNEITAQVMERQRTTQERERLSRLFEQAPGFMALLEGREHRFTLANPAYRRLVGGRDMLGRRVAEALPEAREQGFVGLLDQVFASGEPYRATAARFVQGGEERFLDFVYQPVTDALGTVTGIFVQGTDVTDRRRAEAEAAAASERVALALDAGAIVGTWVWEVPGDRFTADERFAASFGLETERCRVGLPLGEVSESIHPEDRTRVAAAVAEALRQGGGYRCEYRVRGQDGAFRWVEASGRVETDAAGRPLRFPGVLVDAEPRRVAERALRESESALRRLNETLEARVRAEVAAREAAQAQLAHAQRMEALGQLAGGVAHDFNNVLQAVQGGTGLIERRPDDPAGVRRLARMVAEAAGRGASITRRLLAFSRRGDLRTEAVDPVGLLGGLREVLVHTMGAGIEVRVEVPAGLPALLADRGQLETVLVNLATNARDAMEGKGTITLSAVLDGPDGGAVRLCVADGGCGMAPEVLARATEPFFTTKGRGEGTGLGLAMARGFAEQSGGGLAIRSEPGRGTVVSMWFPLAGAGAPVAADEPPPRAPAAGPLGVLLVDDEPLVRELLAEGLRGAGYRVTGVPSGPAALALLEAGEAVDVIVTDLSMPGMDGLDLVAEVHRRLPRLPAILLTGFATDAAELAVGRTLSGTFSLLRKPVTADELAERVAVLLEGRQAAEGGGLPA
jgi:PAS domain S-box-containing protein